MSALRWNSLAWFLAVPYVMTISTQTMATFSELKWKNGKWECVLPSEQCLDWAAALNEGHERRTSKETTGVFYDHPVRRLEDSPTKGWYSVPAPKPKEEFDYHSACGQDDCGAEPK